MLIYHNYSLQQKPQAGVKKQAFTGIWIRIKAREMTAKWMRWESWTCLGSLLVLGAPQINNIGDGLKLMLKEDANKAEWRMEAFAGDDKSSRCVGDEHEMRGNRRLA